MCPRDTYKIHVIVDLTTNPGRVLPGTLECLQTKQQQKRMPPMPMTHKGQVCKMPTDEA